MRGHVRKRGNAWELRAYEGVDPLTNRQKYVTRTFRGGKREAEQALARLVTEVAGGGQAAQDTTAGDLIRDWLALATRSCRQRRRAATRGLSRRTSHQRSAGCLWRVYTRPSWTASTPSSEKRAAGTANRCQRRPYARCMPFSGGRCSRASAGDGSRPIRRRWHHRQRLGLRSWCHRIRATSSTLSRRRLRAILTSAASFISRPRRALDVESCVVSAGATST